MTKNTHGVMTRSGYWGLGSSETEAARQATKAGALKRDKAIHFYCESGLVWVGDSMAGMNQIPTSRTRTIAEMLRSGK